MATWYVNSNAVGTNAGTSWANAWTSIASATGVAAGDEVRVDKTHAQTSAINVTFSNGTSANPVKIFCVDSTASDALATGAALTCNSAGLTFGGQVVVDGLTLTQTVASNLIIGSANGIQRWYNCTFVCGASSGNFLPANGAGALVYLSNCTIDLSAAATSIGLSFTSAGAGTVMRGGTITGRSASATTILLNLSASGTYCVLDGVSVVNTIASLATISPSGGRAWLKRCTLPAYTNVVSGSITNNEVDNYVLLEGCVTGTVSVSPLGLTSLNNRVGTIQSDLTRYRTGGANDGEQANAYSWSLASNAGALAQYSWLETPPLTRWLTAGSRTITVYVASGASLDNSQFWLEVVSPNETGSPNETSQGRYQTTRCADRATAAALTTDAVSSWSGTGVGTKQNVAVTVNPTLDGWVTVRCCLAAASGTCYVDPKLDVT